MVTLYNPRKFGVPFPFAVSQLLMLHYKPPQTKLSDNHPCIMFTGSPGSGIWKGHSGKDCFCSMLSGGPCWEDWKVGVT